MIAAAILIAAAAVTSELPVDAPIVPGATEMDETGRYVSPRSYTETLEFYTQSFKRTGGIQWHNIVNLPGIKAKNIESLRQKTNWEGINIYEIGGRAHIFVIKREVPTAPKATTKPKP